VNWPLQPVETQVASETSNVPNAVWPDKLPLANETSNP
jgi:hypothetical protein